jgi:hypothetical protein
MENMLNGGKIIKITEQHEHFLDPPFYPREVA